MRNCNVENRKRNQEKPITNWQKHLAKMLYATNWYSKLLCDTSSLSNKNKKSFFLIYSLIPNIKKSQIGHLYQPYHFQSCSRNSLRWTPYPAWNRIVLFQTFCKCINSKTIHTQKKNTINSKNLWGSTTTLLSFSLSWIVNLSCRAITELAWTVTSWRYYFLTGQDNHY